MGTRQNAHLIVNGELSQVAPSDRQAVSVGGESPAQRGIADAADHLGHFEDFAIRRLGFDDERERFPPVSPFDGDRVLKEPRASFVSPGRQLADDAVLGSVRDEAVFAHAETRIVEVFAEQSFDECGVVVTRP